MSGQEPAALVVGGCGGIGAAAATALSRRGFVVVAADLSERADVVVDVRSPQSVDAAVAAVLHRYGRLDALVNAAGILVQLAAVDQDDAALRSMLDVHLGGTFRACRAAFPALAERGGAIVNLSSPAGQLGVPRRSAYCASKAAIEGLTRELAVEWGASGVRVNAVSPGYTRTPMLEDAFARGQADPERLVTRVPLGALAEPSAIADAIAFLVTPESRYVTGHVLVVDGGLSINGSAA